MQTARRPLGLATLTMLDLSQPDLIDVAADAGFDFVSLRIRRVTDQEPPFDLSAGSPLLKATVERLAARGIWCSDGDLIRLDGALGSADWQPTLETAAALGAAVAATIIDPDAARAEDSVAALAADAQTAGVVVTLEPMSYATLNSVREAARLARTYGCRVILDSLHMARAGVTLDEVDEAVDQVSVLQLCDGRLPGPTAYEERVAESRSDRLPPGLGDFGLVELIRHVPADLPVAVEVPSTIHRQDRNPVEYAAFLRERVTAVLAAAQMS